jgi:hypothetical protein
VSEAIERLTRIAAWVGDVRLDAAVRDVKAALVGARVRARVAEGEEQQRCAAILRSVMPPAWGAGPRKSWEKAFREALRQIEKKEAD